MEILLEKRKSLRLNDSAVKMKRGCQTAPPDSFDSAVLAVVIIIGKVLTIEIRTSATCGFDTCRCKQNTFPHTPHTEYHSLRKNANRKNKVFRKKREKSRKNRFLLTQFPIVSDRLLITHELRSLSA